MKIFPIRIFLSNFWVSILNLKNAKHLKNISEELIPTAPKRWWNICMLEDKKKDIELIISE